MSFFKKMFGSKNDSNSFLELEPKLESTEIIKESEFVDHSDPVKKDDPVYLISFGTGMPIDMIYAYLKEDHEERGYKDALSNPDESYRAMNKSLIKSDLEVKFRQVTLKYNDDLRNINFHITSRSQAGLIDVVEQLKTKKQTLEEHLKEIQIMKEDLQTGEPYMIAIMQSYERGFLKGLAALSLETLKSR